MENQVLTLRKNSPATIILNGSDDYRNYAVQTRVICEDAKNISNKLGLTIGSDLTVQYNPAGARWELLAGGTLKDQWAGPPEAVMHWLLIAGEHGVVFFLNDRQVFSWAASSPANTFGGALGLFAGDTGVGFARVLVLQQPLTHIVYRDGTGRPVQTQQLADNQVIARHALHDELGRPAIITKPVLYDDTVPGYQAGLVTGFDETTGRMSGDVADYYSGDGGRSDDEGYPYSRRRIENSALSRLQEVGRPGKAFAIGGKRSHTTQYRYGVNGSSPFYGSNADQQYKVRLQSDPDGITTAVVGDLIGNRLAMVSGGSGLPAGSIYTAFDLDYQDNRAFIRTPNYFAPPSGEAKDWAVSRSFDFRNRLLGTDSQDAGQMQSAYDKLGRLRFRLIADGSQSGAQNPCQDLADTPVTILYRRYDPFGRVIEQGNYCVAKWEDTAQHVDDQSWPRDAANWRYRYSYDGDGSQNYTIGRLSAVHTNNGSQGETVESFSYDIFGHTTGYTLQQGAETTAFSYQYDNQGHVLSIDYPGLGELPSQTVTYGHDARGLLTAIGTPEAPDAYAVYSHNAAGQVVTATLSNGSDAITRHYSYHSRGWLQTITDDFSSETLYYDNSNPQQNNTPRYSGLVSAIHYTRNDGTDYSWSYEYDAVGRLQQAIQSEELVRVYNYDPNGNFSRITTNGLTAEFHYQGSNFLRQVGDELSYIQLPSGAVHSSTDLGLTYDFTSRLITGVDFTQTGQSLRFAYGAGVQRLSKTLSDKAGGVQATRRYYPGLHKRPLQEQSDDGKTNRSLRYIYGRGGILAVQTANTCYYTLQDHQRSNRLLVAGAGQVPAATFDYLPYGQAYGDPGGTDPGLLVYRYTGQEWDAETGLYNYRHRLYDPLTSRFLAPDPKRQYFSPYSYTGGHPIRQTDPSGEFSLLGTIISSVEIGVGAALLLTPVAPLGGALIGAGAAGLNYSLRAKHFNAGQYFQVETAAAVSTAEVEAGVALTVLTSGAAYQVGGGTLTGAGMSGLGDTFSQINRDPNGSFNWGEWGISEGIGAAAGTAFGALGAFAGAGAGAGVGAAASSVADLAGDETAAAAAGAVDASAGSGSGAGAAGLVEDTAGSMADAGGGAGGGGGGVGSGVGGYGMVMDSPEGPVDPAGGGPGGNQGPGNIIQEVPQGGPEAPVPPEPAAAPAEGGDGGDYGMLMETSGPGEPGNVAPEAPQAENYYAGGHLEVTGGGVEAGEPDMPISEQWGHIVITSG